MLNAYLKQKIPQKFINILLVAEAFIVICLTGLAIGAADPMQQLMKMNGAFSHLAPDLQNIHIRRVISVGISCAVLMGAFIGPFINYFGLKLTAITGIVAHVLGYICFIYNNFDIVYYLGSILFGIAFQCIVNSHFNVATLFPKCPSLVLALVSSGTDLSYIIPSLLLKLSEISSVNLVFGIYLIGITGICLIFECLCVPFRSNETKPENSLSQDTECLISTSDIGEEMPSKEIYDDIQPKKSKNNNESLNTMMSLKEQFFSYEYAIILIIFILAFLRRKHMAVYIRGIFKEFDTTPESTDANFYTNMNNLLVPYGFVFSIIWGGLVDRIGVNLLTILNNALACLYLILCLTQYMPMQSVTVIVFIMVQSFVFNNMLSYFVTIYGFTNLLTLQGVSASITGLISLAMDSYWGFFIQNQLGSFYNANILILIISLLMFLLPITMMILNRRKKRKTEFFDTKEALPIRRITQTSVSMYDKNSLELLQEKSTLYSN